MELDDFILGVLTLAILFLSPLIAEAVRDQGRKEKAISFADMRRAAHDRYGCELVYCDMWPSYSYWQCSFCGHTIVDENS